MFLLPETLPPEHRNHEPLGHAIANYIALTRQRRLIGYAGAGAFFYGGMFAYIAGTPFAFISYYHVPPQLYGLLFAAGMVGISMATTCSTSSVRDRISAATAVMLQASTRRRSDHVVVVCRVVSLQTGFGGASDRPVGAVVGVCRIDRFHHSQLNRGVALAHFPKRAGAVSALVGAVQYGTGIIGFGMVSTFADSTPWPMGWVIALSGIGSAACAWFLVDAQ